MGRRTTTNGEKKVPKTFQRGKTYEYGTLRIGSDAQSTNPEWARGARIQDGSFFLGLGCRTPAEFCMKNPTHLPGDRSLTFYRVEDGGSRTYIGAGTPTTSSVRAHTAGSGLSDQAGAMMGAMMGVPTTQQVYGDPYQNGQFGGGFGGGGFGGLGMGSDVETVQWLRDEVRRLQSELSGRDQTIHGLYSRLMEKDAEIRTLRDQHHQALQDLGSKLSQAEMMNYVHKKIDSQPRGLGMGPIDLLGLAKGAWDLYQTQKGRGGGSAAPGASTGGYSGNGQPGGGQPLSGIPGGQRTVSGGGPYGGAGNGSAGSRPDANIYSNNVEEY